MSRKVNSDTRAGKLQLWAVGGSSAQPDGLGALARFDSSQWGGQNFAHFKNAEFDAIYRHLTVLPLDEKRAKR
jgi:ABC-type transport system substrate-binding protein